MNSLTTSYKQLHGLSSHCIVFKHEQLDIIAAISNMVKELSTNNVPCHLFGSTQFKSVLVQDWRR